MVFLHGFSTSCSDYRLWMMWRDLFKVNNHAFVAYAYAVSTSVLLPVNSCLNYEWGFVKTSCSEWSVAKKKKLLWNEIASQ